MEYLEDPTANFDADTLFSREMPWKKSTQKAFNFGFTSSAYWFRFRVNVLPDAKEWFLEIDYPLLDRIDLYTLTPGGEVRFVPAGDHMPFYTREIIDRNFIFPQPTEPGIYRYYLRIQTTSSLNFTPIIWSRYTILQRFETEIPLLWFYHGIMFVMAVYNFFLFLSIRERSYLYHAFFLFSWILFTLSLNGFAFQYLWPDSIWWANNCLPFFMGSSLALLGQFARAFSATRNQFPKTDRLLLYGTILPNWSWALASLILPYEIAIKVATALTLLTVILYYFIHIYMYFSGSKAARFWVLAFTVIFFGVMLFVLKTFGILPLNFVTTWSIQIGAVCVVVLLSLGLADKINTMQHEMSILNSDLSNRNREIQSLNDELENRVLERTEQHKSANKALQQSLETLKLTQNQLIQSEKMAALGSLVAGVAHEINTPLGVGLTAASLLYDKTKAQMDLYATGALKRSELEKYLNLAEESTSMVLTNLQRAAELVSSFKQAAVDQSSENLRHFNIKKYIEELLFSLRPQFKRTKHQVNLNCPENIEIYSYPGVFSQVITNLIMNSLIHGFEEKESGSISIDIRTEGQTLVIYYIDDGKGMDRETLEKMFDPFFTTKRSRGGTGLGMHILYNLVTQSLGGSLECTSTPEEGVTFLIQIPMKLTPRPTTDAGD